MRINKTLLKNFFMALTSSIILQIYMKYDTMQMIIDISISQDSGARQYEEILVFNGNTL